VTDSMCVLPATTTIAIGSRHSGGVELIDAWTSTRTASARQLASAGGGAVGAGAGSGCVSSLQSALPALKVVGVVQVDCRHLVAASAPQHGLIHLWNPETGECEGEVVVPGSGSGPVMGISASFLVRDPYTADGDSQRALAAVWSRGNKLVRIVDVGSGLGLHPDATGGNHSDHGDARPAAKPHRGRFGTQARCASDSFRIAAGRDCQCIVAVATGSRDGRVSVHTLTSLCESRQCTSDYGGHDGARAVGSASDGALELGRHVEGDGGVRCISRAFKSRTGSGGQLIASCSISGRDVLLWDVQRRCGAGELVGHTGSVTGVSSGFTDATGRVLIASSSLDGSVRLWDVDSRRCVRVLTGHSSAVECVSEGFAEVGGASDERLIASGGKDDRTVRMWNVDTGACVRVLRGHTAWVVSLSSGIVDGGGRHLLASASWDETIRLWDASTGECVRMLEHSERVCRVSRSFMDSSRRTFVASTSWDGILRVWDVTSGECTSETCVDEEMGFGDRQASSCVSVAAGPRLLICAGSGQRVVVLEPPPSW
jgi:WD40 repeat protein